MKNRTIAAITLLTLVTGSIGLAWSANGHRYNHDRYRSSAAAVVIPAGTPITVRLNTKVSTDDANRGDTWTGTVQQSVYSGNRVVIPAGAAATGVVENTTQGTHDTPAQISLALRQVDVDGQSRSVSGNTEPIVAGTQRAKKLGAVAGGAAAGALIGHTVAKGSHGTLIGGILGGAAGYGLTRHAFRTMQLKPGTEVTFTTSQAVMASRY